jgi:hypothetical protein
VRQFSTDGAKVIFVLEDDDCIYVYASPQHVVRSIEGLDAQECIKAAFDDDGRPYRVHWITPNRYTRLFLGIQSASSGRYTLVPSGAPDPAALLALLERDRPIFPKKARTEIEKLKAHLRKQCPDL